MQKLLAELHRRKVIRVAGVYAVVGWLLAQASALLENALGLPPWFDGVVVTLLLLGFPAALVIAWAFEITPDGLKRTEPAVDPVLAPNTRVASVDVILIGALVLLAAVSFLQMPQRSAATAVVAPAVAAVALPAEMTDSRPSIAVLPFADMSPEGDQAYFSDGLSEELLNQLAQISDLRVIARTSSFAFRGQGADVRTIGQTLGAGHVLEGSVRKAGDQLRITAQLIDAADGAHVWSRTYDRRLEDVFAIQEEIALAVADALSVTLGLGSRRIDVGGTTNFAAYENYLRGEAALAESGRAATTAAVEAYERAVEIDPEFALAWFALAEAMTFMQTADSPNTETYTRRRRDAIARGLEVAPNLPEAHFAHMLQLLDERDWAGAGRAREEIARLDPGGDAWLDAVTYDTYVGRVSKALPYGDDWLRRDPLALVISGQVALMYYWAQEYDLMRAELERGSSLAGDQAAWSDLRFLWLLKTADLATVDAFLADADIGPPGYPQRLRAVLTSPAEGLALVRSLRDDPGFAAPGALVHLASVAGYFGDPELAADLLRENYLERNALFAQSMWDPLLADARRTEAFKEIVRELGLVDFWRESGDWGDYCRPLGATDFECF